jgi:hypothetical protein
MTGWLYAMAAGLLLVGLAWLAFDVAIEIRVCYTLPACDNISQTHPMA